MEDLTTPPDLLPAAEVEMLADNMAATYAARQAYYRDKWNLDAEAAKKEAYATPEKAQHIIENKPSSVITWNDLGVVERNGPEGSHAQLWGRIKDDALAALDGGGCVRAATAERGPWSEAVCLAARARFMGEWKPRGGVEQTLIDILAQTFVKWQFWLEKEVKWGALKDKFEWTDQPEPHSGPRLNYAEAAQYAAQMADRSHRQFMRTLRAMRDLRRYTPTIRIHNEGQVNIGQNQVNQAG